MGVVNWFLQHLSYFGIILVLGLCGTGLPIPEELPVLTAAVLSHETVGGVMHWYLALPACLIGALCGDAVMYAVGYHWGHGVMKNHRWFVRFQHPEWEAHIERILNQHGLKMLLVARFLVGLRSPMYLAAGILRIPFRRFIVYDFFAAIPVVGITFGLGYLFAPKFRELAHDFQVAKYVIMVAAAIIALILMGSWYFKRRYFGALPTETTEETGRPHIEGGEKEEVAAVGRYTEHGE